VTHRTSLSGVIYDASRESRGQTLLGPTCATHMGPPHECSYVSHLGALTGNAVGCSSRALLIFFWVHLSSDSGGTNFVLNTVNKNRLSRTTRRWSLPKILHIDSSILKTWTFKRFGGRKHAVWYAVYGRRTSFAIRLRRRRSQSIDLRCRMSCQTRPATTNTPRTWCPATPVKLRALV